MKLNLSSFYVEPGVVFDFSYKINLFIKSKIEDVIMKPLGLLEIDTDQFLSLIISTKLSQTFLEVKLSRKNKRSKFRNCGIWFPYNEIITSLNPLEKYIENFIKAVPEIFKEWEITEEQIIEFSKTLKIELLNNPEYDLSDEEIKERKMLDEINRTVKSQLGI